jgi:hypothetical protein
MPKSQQTTRIDGKRVVIRTSTSGKVSVSDAPIKESEGQAAQVRALRALPEYGRKFLLAGDMNSAKRGPRAQADAVATGLTLGEADLRIYIAGGKLRMIENKVGKGRLSPAQTERHAPLARLGHPVEVVRFTSTREMAVAFDHPFGAGRIAKETVWFATPLARGRGAIRMLDAYEDWARTAGCVSARMASLANNDVSKIYERRG